MILFEQYPALPSDISYQGIGKFPTPIRELSELAMELNIAEFFLKDDGISAESYGGNKVRKLEFLIAEAIKRGAKRVITYGCAGSNHALATSIYAKQFGLKPACILFPQANSRAVRKNLLYHVHLNTRLKAVTDSLEAKRATDQEMNTGMKTDGVSPLIIPAGGSSPLGNLGFINTGLELRRQMDAGEITAPHRIYIALGTMGSAVGLALGLKLAGLSSEIHAVQVVGNRFANRKKLSELYISTREALPGEAQMRIGLSDFPDNIILRDSFLGEDYAVYSSAGQEAVELAGRHGIQLEGTYTGKTLAALIADARNGLLERRRVLFWNTYNQRPLPFQADKIDYRKLPEDFWCYFEDAVQELDR